MSSPVFVNMNEMRVGSVNTYLNRILMARVVPRDRRVPPPCHRASQSLNELTALYPDAEGISPFGKMGQV